MAQECARRRKISWNKRCKVRLVPIISSGCEKETTWYDQGDMIRFRDEAKVIKELVREHGWQAVAASFGQEEDISCFQNMNDDLLNEYADSPKPTIKYGRNNDKEGREHARRKLRQRRQYAARFAVLEEQRYQKTVGTHRPETIARCYYLASKSFQEEAYARAQEVLVELSDFPVPCRSNASFSPSRSDPDSAKLVPPKG